MTGEDKPLGIEEVVERVAKAITHYRYKPGYRWSDMLESERDFVRGEARAAIEVYEQARASTGEKHDQQ